MASSTDVNTALRSRQSLPSGPCNYRDASIGRCGCDQFWDKCSTELHEESNERRANSDRSTWCVCGHHACFHLKDPGARASAVPTNYGIHGQPLSAVHNRAYRAYRASRASRASQAARISVERKSRPTQQSASQLTDLQHGRRSQDLPSQASTTGLPGIPSICLLSDDQRTATNNDSSCDTNSHQQNVTGLGLSLMQLDSIQTINRQQSPSSTIPDDASFARHRHASFGERLEARAQVIEKQPDSGASVNPARGNLNHVLEFDRHLQVNVPGDTIPDTYNPEEFLQSATEVATPSVLNTPDLNAADQAVHDGKAFIDTLTRLSYHLQQNNTCPTKLTALTSAPGPQLLHSKPASPPQEHVQNFLKSACPQGLQKLISYLGPLHNLLNSIPNVSNTLRDLSSRLDMLENGSFNYVQPEDFNQTLEMYEGRLIEIENRVEEHDKLQQALDDQHSSTPYNRKHNGVITASFSSVNSLQSATSSTLILAAMDRKETQVEIENIKDRLDLLEATALPSSTNPWEVEVVLLPWGRDLRGIWFSPEESIHSVSRTTTQDSEEWTQPQSARLDQAFQPAQDQAGNAKPGASPDHPILNNSASVREVGSGWSSQTISDWASGSAEDWLFPKACGSNNLVYKRLQSRGFIRKVTLTSAGARDIQVSLAHAYRDLWDHFHFMDKEDDSMAASYPGLRASFLPLRKILKSSRLRFLTPAEMSSSALWSAQFLAAGIMMRVSGGSKRLYVTHREAYLQHNEAKCLYWSWQELRQLPRYQIDQDSQMEGNDDFCQPQVAEADAREACWQFVESCDAPPPASLHSSFASDRMGQRTTRLANYHWRRSITPNSILVHKQAQPISPQSELRPQYSRHFRDRTASAPILEQFPPGPSKRRHHSSPTKQELVSQSSSHTSIISHVRPKRRRVMNPNDAPIQRRVTSEAKVSTWNATPRLFGGLPSPFTSVHPTLQCASSDMTSRPSQRSAAIVGISTPVPYATPHSGFFGDKLVFNRYSNGGRTEPEEEDDEGNQSWRGVTDMDESSASSSSSDARIDDEDLGSFSGNDRDLGSGGIEDEDDEDEDEDDVFDSLLGVLEDD